MTNPNKAFKTLKNPEDVEIEICCLECGEIRMVSKSIWWDDVIEIECGECGNLFDWELTQ